MQGCILGNVISVAGEGAGVAVLCAGDVRLRREEGEHRHGIPCRGGGVAEGWEGEGGKE